MSHARTRQIGSPTNSVVKVYRRALAKGTTREGWLAVEGPFLVKEALAAEIMEAYQGQGNAIRKRDEVHKMAQANKAFAHFRW